MKKSFICVVLLFIALTVNANPAKKLDLSKLYAVERAAFPVHTKSYLDKEDIEIVFLQNNKYLISEGNTLYITDNSNKKKIVSENLVSGYYKLFSPRYFPDIDVIIYFERTNNTFGGLSMYVQKVDSINGRPLPEREALLTNVFANTFSYHYVRDKKLLIFQINDKLYRYNFKTVPRIIFNEISSYIVVEEENKVYVVKKDDKKYDDKSRRTGIVYVTNYNGSNKIKIADNVNYCEYYKKLNMFLISVKKDYYRCNLYVADRHNNYKLKPLLENIIFRDLLKQHKESPFYPFAIRSIPCYELIPEESKLLAIKIDGDVKDLIQSAKRNLTMVNLRNNKTEVVLDNVVDFDYNVVTKNVVFIRKISPKFYNIYKMNFNSRNIVPLVENAYMVPQMFQYYKDPEMNRDADYIFYAKEDGNKHSIHLLDVATGKELYYKSDVTFNNISENIYYSFLNMLAIHFTEFNDGNTQSYYSLANPATASEITFRASYIKPSYNLSHVATLENRKYNENEERPYLVVYELTTQPKKEFGYEVSADGKVYFKLKGDELRKLTVGTELSKLLDKERAVKDKIERINKQIDDKLARLDDDYKKRKEEYANKIKELERQFNEIKSKRQEDIGNLKDQFAEKKKELKEKLMKDTEGLKKKLEALRSNFDKSKTDLLGEIDRLKKERETALKDKNIAEAELAKILKKVDDNKKMIAKSRSDLEQQKQKIAAERKRVEAEIASLAKEKAKVKKELGQAQKEMNDAINQKNKADAERQKILNEIPKLEQKREELRQAAQLDTINKERDELKGEIGDLENKKKGLEGNISKLSSQKEKLEPQIDSIQQKINDLKSKQGELNKEVGNLNRDKSKLQRELGKLTNDMKKAQEEVDKLIAQKNKLIEDIKIDEENTKKSFEALQKGLREYGSKNYKKAVEYFNEALSYKPDNFLAQLYKMDIILKQMIDQQKKKQKRLNNRRRR